MAEKYTGFKFHWESGCSMRTDRQTDMTKLIVAIRNSAKEPKILRIANIFYC
jgi:hypothetical protein